MVEVTFPERGIIVLFKFENRKSRYVIKIVRRFFLKDAGTIYRLKELDPGGDPDSNGPLSAV